MAKRRYGKKGKRSAMSKRPHIPMALAAPLIADGLMVLNVAKDGISGVEQGNLTYYFTGWTGSNMDMSRVVQTYGKYAVGGLVSMAATKFGVNRKIYKLTRGYVGI